MINYHPPQPAFHEELTAIKYSLKWLVKHSQCRASRRGESARLKQKYINLELAQAMHEMRRNHA